MQNTYWGKMTQFKYSIYYLEAHMLRSVRINRWIRIILAIASSASIAAWTQWQGLAFFLGISYCAIASYLSNK